MRSTTPRRLPPELARFEQPKPLGEGVWAELRWPIGAVVLMGVVLASASKSSYWHPGVFLLIGAPMGLIASLAGVALRELLKRK
jgi:hypothetical protein